MAKSLTQLSDAELLDVANQTIAAMTANPAGYGTTLVVIGDLSDAASAFQTSVTNQVAAVAASAAATSAKEAFRRPLIDELRTRRDTAKVHGTSDSLMAATHLPSGGGDSSVATVPAALVDTSRRLHHTISWQDAGTPDSKKRPGNATSVEIWRKIDGPPPSDVSDCTFVAVDTASPYITEYSGENGGKIVHYMLRWHLRDGSTTPFGETVSATITA